MTDEDEKPPLCTFLWQQGVGGKRHLCNRLDYPKHLHACCCGTLLAVQLANALGTLKGADS